MAVKTKAQILAEIASLLADNTTGDISASDIRTCLNDITDSYFDAPYKKLVFNLIQVGTSAPEFTDVDALNNPLENTLGEVPTLARTSAGVYTLTVVAPLFDKYKLWIGCGHQKSGGTRSWFIPLLGATGLEGYLYFNQTSDYVLTIRSVNAALTPTDLSSLLGSTNPISFPEIRSYS